MGKREIKRSTRHEQRRRTLGSEAKCEHCGWSDSTAITKRLEQVLCYECRARELGNSQVERHHHLGRAVDPATFPVLGNIHRDLSDRQHDWPVEVRANPQRDPLLWLAAAMLGLRDHLAWWVSWVDRIAQFLTQLAASLTARHGERWWETIGVVPAWQQPTT